MWIELANTARKLYLTSCCVLQLQFCIVSWVFCCSLCLVPGVNGLRMLGIIHDTVVFLIEQLYGAKHCHNYKFRFHKPEEANEPPLNPHGSARAEVHLRQV